LAPIWDELAAGVSSPNIVIAKMDATANDFPAGTPFQISGFPTLKLYKANSGEIVDYSGDRTLESLQAFLKSAAVHGAEVEATGGEAEEESSHDEL
jgi:protein disulfide-isomerase A1